MVDGVGEWLDKSLEMGMLQRSPDLDIGETLWRVEVET